MTTTSPTLTTSMPSPIPVGELAYARAFLVARQVALYLTRRLCTEDAAQGDVFRKLDIWNAEKQVLAALSWVWDAQERARERDWSKMTQTEIFEDLSKILPFQGSLVGMIDPEVVRIIAQPFDRNEFARRLAGKKRSRARAKAA